MNKRKIKIGILISSILLFGLIGLLSNDVKATTDIDYTFENNEIIDLTNPLINSTFNMRNQTEYTEIYNATYSFTDDIVGNDPIGFNVIEGTACTVQVISDSDGHNKVLELFDTTNAAGGWAVAQNEFTPRDNGTIEMWVRFRGSTDNRYFYAYNDITATIGCFLWVTSSTSFYDANSNVLFSYNMNQWYHVKVWFDCDLDIYSLWVNGIHYVDEDSIPTGFEVSGIGMFQMNTKEVDSGTDYWFEIDGLGYGWNVNYTIGDNIIPYSYQNDTLEVDKYEWTYEGINDFYELGDTPIGWDKTTSGVAGAITIGGRSLDTNKELYMIAGNGVSTLGIEKTTFNLDGEIFNITLDTYFHQWDSSNDDLSFEIKSKDLTVVYRLNVEGDGALNYWDGATFIEIDTGLSVGVNYTFNLFIDYYSDTCLIRRHDDGVLDSIYFTPLSATGKQGLDEVFLELYTFSAGNYMIVLCDSIGVYSNGLSEVVEYGWVSIDCNESTETWTFQNQNLFTINASGLFTLHGSEGFYFGENSGFETALEEILYNNTEQYFYNIYDSTMNGNGMTDPFIVLFFNETQFFNNISYINIEGVILREGSNEYSLEFTYGNVDINENYFYVSGNHLYYSIIYDDTDLEYIQASFDISNVAGENRSCRYYSDTNGNYAELRLKYTDTTVTALALQTSYYISNLILSQDKELDYIQLLITDDDKFDLGSTTGRVSGITLQYLPNIALTITTLDLLGMITVLIIIIIPTLVIARKIGSVAIIPMLFLMCLLCVFTELIPIWLFVVITISLGSFYIVNSKIKGSI